MTLTDTLRRGDIVTGTGRFDGEAVEWFPDSVRVKLATFQPGDRVAWVAEGSEERRTGEVRAVEIDGSAHRQWCWIKPDGRLLPVTLDGGTLTRIDGAAAQRVARYQEG